MARKTGKKLVVTLIITAFFTLLCGAGFLAYRSMHQKPAQTVSTDTEAEKVVDTQPVEAYRGEQTIVANSFSIKTPNGWAASVSNRSNFTAIMFARPNQLTSLIYNPQTPPVVDQSGTASWNGLTEHFYIIAPTPSRQFSPASHLEITSEPFTFDDGVIGQKYTVIKHTEEAKKYGGLQKDTEWRGRTYIYEKDGKRVEAHLALYPSTPIDIEFYESVIRTLNTIQN